jgi:hypothetical protein
MITKTDLLSFRNAPMHLWAEKHGKVERPLSTLDLHIMQQGQEVEKLAREFLQLQLLSANPDLDIRFQATLVDGDYEARIDALVFDPAAEAYDLYEIKSSTSVKAEHKWDVAFQALVAEASLSIRNVYLVLVNKEYVRHGEIDPSKLFIIEPADEFVGKSRGEVKVAREAALQVVGSNSPDGVEACHKPSDCLCPSLCHPTLPNYPIYDVPGLRKNKLLELRGQGILSIEQIPDSFPLTDRQKPYVIAARQRQPLIDIQSITAELQGLEFPLYFLDYEAYNPAVPLFDGYKPYEYITFQYSLHVIDKIGEEPRHYEWLGFDGKDPANELAASLKEVVGEKGSVIVWNKTFEQGRNKELVEWLPDYKSFFDNLNDRIYDLMEIFSKGYYIHPDFHGSASIKKVLPVLVKDFDQGYDALPISQGDQAMLAWLEMMNGHMPEAQIEETRINLLEYCKLDTLAMVKSWQAISSLATAG